MGNIEYIDGDVLNVECDVILHQVNCKGIMGSGVALGIKQKYPEVFVEYLNKVMDHSGPSDGLLGEILVIKAFDGKKVANLFSQDSFGHGRQYTDYEAMRKGLTTLNKMCNGEKIALPYKMGSDRGGGDWSKVLKIITECLTECNVIIVRYNK